MSATWTNTAGVDDAARLVAVPCDNAYIQLDDPGLYSGEDVDALIAALTRLRPHLVAARNDADCVGHTH
jgi:hypothetical protein